MENNLVNEAELFCSNMQFRRYNKGKKGGMMIGDESKKDEDIILYVSQQLKEITKKYVDAFEKYEVLNEEKKPDEGLKALAVYVACYYHDRNEELAMSLNMVRNDKQFEAFRQEKMAEFEKLNTDAIDMRSFEIYCNIVKKSEDTGSKAKL